MKILIILCSCTTERSIAQLDREVENEADKH